MIVKITNYAKYNLKFDIIFRIKKIPLDFKFSQNEKLEAEQKGRKVEVESLTSRLAEKTKSGLYLHYRHLSADTEHKSYTLISVGKINSSIFSSYWPIYDI